MADNIPPNRDGNVRTAVTMAVSTLETPAPTLPPMHRVLQTTELLSNILICLDMKDLVISTGVCRHWKKVVARDPKAQEKLFRRATIITRTEEYVPESGISRKLANLRRDDDLDGVCGKMLTLHPLLELEQSGSWRSRTPWFGNDPSSRLDDEFGSWRKMFVTQPPCTKIYVICADDEGEVWDEIVQECEKSKGVRLEDLVKTIAEAMDELDGVASDYGLDLYQQFIEFTVNASGHKIGGVGNNANDRLARGRFDFQIMELEYGWKE